MSKNPSPSQRRRVFLAPNRSGSVQVAPADVGAFLWLADDRSAKGPQDGVARRSAHWPADSQRQKARVSIRLFNVIDDFNREGLGIELDCSLPPERVIRSHDRIIEWRGKPAAIRCDNGPEYISAVTLAWAAKQGIRIDFIQPGQPQQNA